LHAYWIVTLVKPKLTRTWPATNSLWQLNNWSMVSTKDNLKNSYCSTRQSNLCAVKRLGLTKSMSSRKLRLPTVSLVSRLKKRQFNSTEAMLLSNQAEILLPLREQLSI
jgi:hypothetical protein